MSRPPRPIRYLETITKHVQMNFGTNAFVLHEHTSSTVHVDLHVVPPNHSRPYFTLLTSGMSDLDMRVPAGLKDLALAEVCLCLPGNWPLSLTDFGWRKPEYFWPIALLQRTARYVHRHKTWFALGHKVGEAENPVPIEYGQKCKRMLESYGWNLLGIENAGPAPDNGEFSEEVEDSWIEREIIRTL